MLKIDDKVTVLGPPVGLAPDSPYTHPIGTVARITAVNRYPGLVTYELERAQGGYDYEYDRETLGEVE